MALPLASSTFGEDEARVIREVIESDRFTMGERVAAFEQAFAEYFGRRYAVMVNSGSSANLVAVASLCYRREDPIQAGDEVIVPCIGWSTTYSPLQQYGLRLKFVDVDTETLNYDIDQLRDAVGPRTRMIVTVSVLGNPCPFDEILGLCREHGIVLFEDNCESMGARLGGEYTGSFGLVSTFSTFFSHHISTIEGGMVLTDDLELACLARSIRNHGWTRGQPDDSPIFEHSGLEFEEAYRFILPGYNVRPTEIAGALGLCQLPKLGGFIEARRANARRFVELFGEDERFVVQREHGESSWFSFTMVVRPEAELGRPRVLDRLRAAGIEYRMVTGGSFPRHEAIRHFDHEIHSCDQASLVHDNGFFVGNHIYDLRRELDELRAVLDEL